jgi:hypothetical protein
MSDIGFGNPCYACLRVKSDMLKPCDNDLCGGRICKDCVKKQILNGNEVCGYCRNDIVKSKKFNWYSCSEMFMSLSFSLILIVGGTAVVFVGAFGKSFNHTCNYDNSYPDCGRSKCGIIILTVLICVWFWPGDLIFWLVPRSEREQTKFNILLGCCFSERFKNYKYLFNMVVYSIVNLIICIGHFIGFVTYGPLFNVEKLEWSEFYTWKTCIAGYVMYLIIIAFLLLLLILYGIYSCIKFNYTETVYGAEVDESTYILKEKLKSEYNTNTTLFMD